MSIAAWWFWSSCWITILSCTKSWLQKKAALEFLIFAHDPGSELSLLLSTGAQINLLANVGMNSSAFMRALNSLSMFFIALTCFPLKKHNSFGSCVQGLLNQGAGSSLSPALAFAPRLGVFLLKHWKKCSACRKLCNPIPSKGRKTL